jgi:hypothetical protein
MMSPECLDHVERIAKLLASPAFGERSRKRQQNERIAIMLDAQKRTAELVEKLNVDRRARDENSSSGC